MHILLVLLSPNPQPDAAWARISFFAKFFKSKGNDVKILGSFSLRSMNKMGLHCWHGIKLYNFIPLIMMINFVSSIFNIMTSLIISLPLIMLLRSDIIIISVPTGEAAYGIFLISKLLRKKVIFDYRDEWEDHFISVSNSPMYKKYYGIFKNQMSKCYSKSLMVSTVTAPFRENLKKRNVLNVKLVPNGADCSIFRPYNRSFVRKKYGINEDDFVLVYSGGIGGYYRVDLIIKALPLLSNKIKNLKLCLLGSGPDTVKVLSLASELKIDDKVKYFGSISDKVSLAEIISCGNLGIIPYDSNPLWKNSLPAKFFEYCACEVPIVATTHPDSILAQIINENNIGFICKPENVNELVVTLENSVDTDLKSCGSRASALIRNSYDRNLIAQDFLNIIEKLTL